MYCKDAADKFKSSDQNNKNQIEWKNNESIKEKNMDKKNNIKSKFQSNENYLNIGFSYYLKGDLLTALEYFNMFDSSHCEYFDSLLLKSGIYCDYNDYDKALEQLDHALKLKPNNIQTIMLIALITKKMDDRNAFEKVFDYAKSIKPCNQNDINKIANLYSNISALSLIKDSSLYKKNKSSEKIHVILIQPSEPFGKMADIPLSIIGIAAVLQEASISVEILDARLHDLSVPETIDILKTKQFNLIGITGFNNSYRYIKDFCFEFKRKFKNITLIAGGPFILTQPEIILKRVPIDVACIGDGEEIIVELVNRLVKRESIDHIPNIAFLNGNTIQKNEIKWLDDYDKIPIPAYNLLDMDTYINNMTYDETQWEMYYFPISSGRGCVHHCYYCGRPSRKKVRRPSPEKIIEHLDYLNKHYGIKSFLFDEDSPFYPREWIIKFCKILIESKRNYHFYVTGCPEQTDEEIVKLLKEAGCVETAASVEHWNPDIQKAFYRGTQSKHILNAWSLFKKYNLINREFNLLWGHPKDTALSFRQSYLKSIELSKQYDVTCFWLAALVVYQNSKLQKDAMRLGKIVDFEDYMYSNGGYGPYVNLTSENDEVYKGIILELKTITELKTIIKAYTNAIIKELPFGQIEALYNHIIVLTKTLTNLRHILTNAKDKNCQIQNKINIPLYDPKKNYYNDIACYKEILDLKANSRLAVFKSKAFDGYNTCRLFNSERVSQTKLIAFIEENPTANIYEDRQLISLNDINIIDIDYIIISEDLKNNELIQKFNNKIKNIIWISKDSLQPKQWTSPAIVGGYYNMKFWDVNLENGAIVRKKIKPSVKGVD